MTTVPPSSAPSGLDPGTTVTAVAAAVTKTQPYVDPTPDERDRGGVGLARLAIGDLAGAAELLGPLGFTVTTDVDPASGRQFAMAVAELGAATSRRWGLYLVDLSAPPRLCVAVPHPRSDLGCEQLALRLWRAVPGAILAMASVHRDAANGTGVADNAHNSGSLFHHLWVALLGPRGVPQVQVHGFADSTAREQVAVSTGAGPISPAAVRIADDIEATGLDTSRSWVCTDPDLRATTNVQGIAARDNDWVWVHIEHNRTVRDTESLWQPAIDAVAAADPALMAFDRPSPGGAGHAARPVGAASSTGRSRYLAREDHVHRGATSRHTHPEPLVRFPVVVVPDAATITVDSTRGDHFRVAVAGDRTLAVPANGVDGQRIVIEVLAAGGDRAIGLDPAIGLCSGVQSPVAIGAGRRWFASLVHVHGAGWLVVAGAQV
jgi:hypothetical protein